MFIDSVVLPAHGDATTALSVYYNNSLNILVVNLPLISVNYFQGNINEHSEIYILQKVHSR